MSASRWSWRSARRGMRSSAWTRTRASVEALASGRSHIEDVPDASLAAIAGRFRPTTLRRTGADGRGDRGRADAADAEPRARPAAAHRPQARWRRCSRLVSSWCSSRPPTRERCASASCRCSRSRGSPAAVTSTPPSRPSADPGRTDYTLRTTPKVVGGLTPECLRRAVDYRTVCNEVVEVTTPEAAELTKLLENIFRSVNIALVNELACSATAWASMSGRSSMRRPRSRTASCRSSRGPAWAGTASGRPVLPVLAGA